MVAYTKRPVNNLEDEGQKLNESNISLIPVTRDVATIVMPLDTCQGIAHYKEEVPLWSHKEERVIDIPVPLRSYQ